MGQGRREEDPREILAGLVHADGYGLFRGQSPGLDNERGIVFLFLINNAAPEFPQGRTEFTDGALMQAFDAVHTEESAARGEHGSEETACGAGFMGVTGNGGVHAAARAVLHTVYPEI